MFSAEDCTESQQTVKGVKACCSSDKILAAHDRSMVPYRCQSK